MRGFGGGSEGVQGGSREFVGACLGAFEGVRMDANKYVCGTEGDAVKVFEAVGKYACRKQTRCL
jgi:hypothetical protein